MSVQQQKKNLLFSRSNFGRIILMFVLLLTIFAGSGCSLYDSLATIDTVIEIEDLADDSVANQEVNVQHGNSYISAEEVALYVHQFEELPPNYITKSEARDLGWLPSSGNLAEVAPGMLIGGDRFGNREGLLPEAKGRSYYECDLDYIDGVRNAKRLVYSSDGLIFYTDDHYASFEQLY